MAFAKERTIYESSKVRIFINQCHNPGKKTKLFAVRRDDQTGLSFLLGLIKFDGAWRQFVFEPEADLKFCAVCMEGISTFAREQTKRWRQSLHG